MTDRAPGPGMEPTPEGTSHPDIPGTVAPLPGGAPAPGQLGEAPAGAGEPALEASTTVDSSLDSAATAPSPATSPGHRGRSARGLGRIRGLFRLPRSRRGVMALLLIFGGVGAASVFGAASVIAWTETADFCGRCHQMGPELAAYEAGPHREVSCAECHVEPGVGGFIKAKLNGTKQLVDVLLGTYPKPVPPPNHSMLPSYTDTCLRCHSTQLMATSGVKTKTQFTEDEKNSRQFVGLLIRPGGGDVFDVNRSVHWHVLQDVRYVSADENAQKIDYVKVTRPDGTVQEFISQDKVTIPENPAPDVQRILTERPERKMDCIECHNRIGHDIPNPREGLDQALLEGKLDSSLPFLKREAMRLLTADYPTVESADAAIDTLRDYYQLKYPDVAAAKDPQISAAVTEVKLLYQLTATPEMKVTAKTYPDNLGHMDFPGCFRCHDGGHYEIKDGAVTKKAIPSQCDTCHTFPQIGKVVATLPFGQPPATHDDTLYVFNHSKVANSVDPGTQSCGECHARDYCANCHDTGAVNVKHDDMTLNHAKIARQDGTASCAYCHQPVYCARCHNEPVLPTGGSLGAGGGDADGGNGSVGPWPSPSPEWTLLPSPAGSGPSGPSVPASPLPDGSLPDSSPVPTPPGEGFIWPLQP